MILSLKNVKYNYQEKDILKDVSFDVNEGEKILISGSNGSGKSTLLKIIAGSKRTEGVEFKGKRIGYVLQNPEDQFIYETVEDEIAFGLENKKLSRTLIVKKVNSIMKLIEIEDLKERKIETLSGGQKQKVAIASQLVLDIDLLLLDEISSMLDPESTRLVNDVVEKLKDVTVIKITHNPAEVLMMDRVLVLSDGVIKEEVNTTEFFNRDDLLEMARMNRPLSLLKEVKKWK